MKNIKFYSNYSSYQADKQSFNSLMGGGIISYVNDVDSTYYFANPIIEGLAAITTSQTITFKATTYSTLTAAEIKTATDKGWTITSK